MMHTFEELEANPPLRHSYPSDVVPPERRGTEQAPSEVAVSPVATRRLMMLPGDAMQTPPWEVLDSILRDRDALLEAACALVVPASPDETADVLRPSRAEVTDVRRGWLVAVLGEWRDPRAIPALISCLAERAVWAWDDLVLALTRIGPPAVDLLRQVAGGRAISPVARERAVRALGSVALAVHRGSYRAPGDDGTAHGALRQQILCDLELLLNAQTDVPRRLVFRAAESLCANGAEHCSARIEALYEGDVLRQFDADDRTDRFALRALLAGDRQLPGYGFADYSIFRMLGLGG